MKIYISADIEGISGVVNKSHAMVEGWDYQRARKLMMDEVNAAVKGALTAGATEILINDSHGFMTNLCIEALNPKARLLTGSHKTYGMMQGIDETYSAVLLIGYHGRHNTSAVLSHSFYGTVVSEIKINGTVVGELELNALLAASYGVPVVLVSGDDVLAEQANAYHEEIETVIVKTAISRYSANCIHPDVVHQMLETAVQRALNKPKNGFLSKMIEGTVLLELSFMNSGMAEACVGIPMVELVKPNCVSYKAESIQEAYRMRSVLTTLAASTV